MLLVRTLISSLFRAFFRIVLLGIVSAVFAGGVALGLAYFMGGRHWPPSLLTEVAAIGVAVLGAYASGLTVLVQEAVRGVTDVEHGVAREVERVA